jgi:thiol-disulfide isomerase/thioredoxin
MFALALDLLPGGSEAPTAETLSLSLPRLGGGSLGLAEAPGKVLVVNFWARWCPPCKAEIPGLVEFWREAPAERVEFRAVNLTSTEAHPEALAEFARSRGMGFPILLDERGLAAAAYGIRSIPTTLVFDPEGRLVEEERGAVTRARLEELVRRHSLP